MKNSLSKEITEYYKHHYPKFLNGGEAERLALNLGFKSSNAGRRCRELCEGGVLERELRTNPDTGIRSVWYRYKPTEHERLSWNMRKMLESNYEAKPIKETIQTINIFNSTQVMERMQENNPQTLFA